MCHRSSGFAAALTLALICVGAVAQSEAPQQTQRPSLGDLRTYAEKGHPEAQTQLALRLSQGDGVLPDDAAAVSLLRRAADQGHAQAQNLLGQHLFAGRGVQRDVAAALAWLEKAADQGDAGHILDYGKTLQAADQMEAAVAAYRAAADKGLLEAFSSLGLMYQSGFGVEQDYAEARSLLEHAAMGDDPRAMNNLGLLYVRGHGVEQDYVRAVELFTSAAELGLATAMGNLAVMYENGFGVAQNDELHALWLERSQSGQASSGVPGGLRYDPALANTEMTPELLNRIQSAAQGGDPVAQFRLGWALMSANGATPEQLQLGRFWFQQAASRGHAVSMANLGQLHARGLTVPQDYLRAYAWTSAALAAGAQDSRPTLDWLAARMPLSQVAAAQEFAKTLWRPAPAPTTAQTR